MKDSYIVLVVGQDYDQITEWMYLKLNKEGSTAIYNKKDRKLTVSSEDFTTTYYGYSKNVDINSLQGIRAHYCIFLEGDYSSSLVNEVIKRCSRTGLISEIVK